MPTPILHEPEPAATGASARFRADNPHRDEVAVPADLLLDMARSVLVEHQRIINEQRTEITQLRAALKAAAAVWMPEGTIIQ